jgi:hypothetical protein
VRVGGGAAETSNGAVKETSNLTIITVSAPIDYPAILAALENELADLITESLWQLERIGDLQRKIRAVTQQMEDGLAALTFPPAAPSGSLN